jgi:hypothetical protein
VILPNRALSCTRLIFCVAAFASALPAYPWGAKGHEAIGAIADRLILGSHAATRVGDLLDGGSLEKYSIWADCAKGKTYCRDWFDDEMKAFGADNPDHHGYHYTDIPFQEARYFPDSVGANPNDIVHVVRQCIDVLRGQNSEEANPHGFSARIALILLAHLVGDLHQPLHAGAAYIGPDSKYVNPNQPGSRYTETHGGNYVMVTSATNLHAYWDTHVVSRTMTKRNAESPEVYASVVLGGDPPNGWVTEGEIENWPQKWANESIALAADVYARLELGPRYVAQDKSGNHPTWNVERKPSNYATRARDAADAQLAKAGYRLAELLKHIWP